MTLCNIYTNLAGSPWILGQFPRSIRQWSNCISILTLPNQSGRLPVGHFNSNPRRCLGKNTYLTNKFVQGMIWIGILHLGLEGPSPEKKRVWTPSYQLKTRQPERLVGNRISEGIESPQHIDPSMPIFILGTWDRVTSEVCLWHRTLGPETWSSHKDCQVTAFSQLKPSWEFITVNYSMWGYPVVLLILG